MNESEEKQLEIWAEGTLRQLVDRQAPAELSKQVWATLHAREQRVWWRRAWTLWPKQGQKAVILCNSVLALGLIVYLPQYLVGFGDGILTQITVEIQSWLKPINLWWGEAKSVGISALNQVNALRWAWWLVLVGLGLVYVSFAGVGFALYRVLRRPSIN
ncbi:MAG: hypothetical protein EXS23_04300 [Pedosphaera sp.]|nr:hypothetical protein [Pedosphaera sp.]